MKKQRTLKGKKPRKYDEEFFEAAAEVFKTALMTMKNEALREMCRHQLLPVSGNKAALASRLYDHFDRCTSEINMSHTSGDLIVTLTTYKQ